MTDDELAGQPGGVATRTDDPGDDPGDVVAAQVFTPKDFRLNLQTKLAVAEQPPVSAPEAARPAEPLPNLDSPAIRKLTWEHVVSDRPQAPTPSETTTVPLPPPPSLVPPPPPSSAAGFQPPAPEPAVVPLPAVVEDEEIVDDEVDVEVVGELDLDVEVDVDDPDEDLAIDVDDEVDAHVEEELEDELEVVDEEPEPQPEPVVVIVAATAPVPEVNRLGSVPDLIDDDDSPIELPPITPSGPVVAHPQSVYSPVLAETLYVPPPQVRTTTNVAAMVADQKGQRHKPVRKQKRHLLRTFMTLVVLFGLLAGGAFAAKEYLLHEPTWTAELKPLADDVSTTRDLQFKASVVVTEVPVADYAQRLASSAIASPATQEPVWRALGLVNGELDLDLVGGQAANDLPAFYDPATKTILVADDLKPFEHLYRFAMHRALTVALLDQHFDWSSRVASATPAVALAIRATIDGDALAVANRLATDSPDLLTSELLAFAQGHGKTVAPSPYAAHIVGRAGAALRPTIAAMESDPAELAVLEKAVPGGDGLFDPVRSPDVPASMTGTQGMMFWYYVLASRIDDGQAWTAAVRWASDSIAMPPPAPAHCVDANVGAVDAEGANVLLAAFTSWAAAAPVESTTTVSLLEGNKVAIHACDPGSAVTGLLPVKVPVAFGGAAVERALVQAANAASSSGAVDAPCLVAAARIRATPLASPMDDAPVVSVKWQPAYVAANIDLAAGCAPAAG